MIYRFYNGDIITPGYHSVCGWISNDILLHLDCIDAVTKAIQSKKHDLLVTSTAQNNVNETPTNVFIKHVGTGYYIASHDSDLYYAYFSTRMKCAKMCANAILKVFEKP